MSDVMPAPRVADLWEPWQGGPAVRCGLCAHHCRIEPADRGLCGVRENRDGTLYTLVYGCPISTAVDPIEKKPLFHFLPGLELQPRDGGLQFHLPVLPERRHQPDAGRTRADRRAAHVRRNEVVGRAARGGLPEHLVHLHRAHDLLRVRARLRPPARPRPVSRTCSSPTAS